MREQRKQSFLVLLGLPGAAPCALAITDQSRSHDALSIRKISGSYRGKQRQLVEQKQGGPQGEAHSTSVAEWASRTNRGLLQ